MTAGLLVRVGIDSTAGCWIAPCRSDGRFCYVPMGSSDHLSKNYDPRYEQCKKSVDRLCKLADGEVPRKCKWPTRLPKHPHAHFDPDFENCTHGEGSDGRRGKRILDILPNADKRFIVFYAALRSIDSSHLVYSIIGFYWIREIRQAKDIPPTKRGLNEHTRHPMWHPDSRDIVIYARKKDSGRLLRHIPIGEYRDRAWRVRRDLCKQWGDVDLKKGYLQRGMHPAKFKRPERFLKWFYRQSPKRIRRNNVLY